MTFSGNFVGRELDRQARRKRWNEYRSTHQWVTLDGEEYSCNACDTKTGLEPCPGLGDPDEASAHSHEAVTGQEETT